VLYMLPAHGTANLLGGTGWFSQPYEKFWDGITTWVAVHVFHLSGHVTTRFLTGSGDTTLDYIQTLCNVAVALAGMIVWTVLDRRRMEYRTLHAWLRVGVRYTLAVTMLSYGFAKVYPMQFPLPRLARLMEPYGEFSPMGALWWFMGSAPAYVIFAGSAEVLGGLLLFTRRTTTLGAMVCFGVLSNIVALNYMYDVPVKLYSTNLLLMAVFLLAPDLRRLARVLVMNRGVEAADQSLPSFANRKLRIAGVALQVVFIGYVLYNEVHGGWEAYQQVLHPKRPALYGLYQVESGNTQWRNVAVDFPQAITVRNHDDTVTTLPSKYDEASSLVSLTIPGKGPVNVNYSRPDADHVLLKGLPEGDVRLKKIDASKFLLLSRGFHWINEYPLNR